MRFLAVSRDKPLTPQAWNATATRLLRVEMARRDVTFKELSRRLARFGVALENAQLSNKVNRGTFSLVFFLQCMQALDIEVRLTGREDEPKKLRGE